MVKKTPKKTTRKGPSREIALKNLEKAREGKLKKAKQSAHVADLSSDMSSDMSVEDMLRTTHKKTYQSIADKLGRHVEDMLDQSSKDRLIKNAYSVKSLSDMYQSYIKAIYPLGLDSRDSSQLNHLLGSILPQLKATLNIDMSAPSIKQTQIVDISPNGGADT